MVCEFTTSHLIHIIVYYTVFDVAVYWIIWLVALCASVTDGVWSSPRDHCAFYGFLPQAKPIISWQLSCTHRAGHCLYFSTKATYNS